MRVLGSVQDAEDVSQEVFVEAFRMHQAGRVKSWPGLLVRLATLRSIDRLRKSRHVLELSEGDGVSDEEPYERVVAAELAASLRQGIAQLPEQQSIMFVMHYFDDLSRDEIATTLGTTTGAVSTALHKGRQRLMDQLAAFNRGDTK